MTACVDVALPYVPTWQGTLVLRQDEAAAVSAAGRKGETADDRMLAQ